MLQEVLKRGEDVPEFRRIDYILDFMEWISRGKFESHFDRATARKLLKIGKNAAYGMMYTSLEWYTFELSEVDDPRVSIYYFPGLYSNSVYSGGKEKAFSKRVRPDCTSGPAIALSDRIPGGIYVPSGMPWKEAMHYSYLSFLDGESVFTESCESHYCPNCLFMMHGKGMPNIRDYISPSCL